MNRFNGSPAATGRSVFQGKETVTCTSVGTSLNKETTLLAFCLVLSLLAMLMTIPLLLSSFEPASQHQINMRLFEVSELPAANGQ